MAICWHCNKSFYGKVCWHCNSLAIYKCWNCFFDELNGNEDVTCGKCRWYICPKCDCCGCQENGPLSNEEKKIKNYLNEKIEEVMENGNRDTRF